jgi:hypothetical protein
MTPQQKQRKDGCVDAHGQLLSLRLQVAVVAQRRRLRSLRSLLQRAVMFVVV